MVKLNHTLSIPKSLCVFLLFFFTIITFSVISAHSKLYDSNLTWKVLESQHFSVIFPVQSTMEKPFEYQQTAICIAEIAEETYHQITPMFGKPYHPDKKITIILEDFSDSTYGFASTIPNRTIRLNLTAPGFKSFNTEFNSWLKIVIAHEYTHLAHFDMTNKGTSFLRFFLGQIIAPNALQPLWAVEGLAIYNESKWTTGGRLEDSRYKMYLRSDFLENNLKSLDQLQGDYLVSWPGGNAPYIYGQSLVHFIVQKFGEEKLISISKIFCTYPLLGMNHALKKAIEIDQNELFTQWKNEQINQFNQQIEQINQVGKTTESLQLTNHQYWVDNPEWLQKTNEHITATLIYKVNIPQLYSTIREYNPLSKKENILIKRTSGHGTSYSISPDRQFLIYTKLSQYQQYYSYNDLFLYHLNSGKQIQISKGMRIKDPAWRLNHPENHVIAVINQAGSNNLVLFSLNHTFFKDESPDQALLSSSGLIYLTDFNDGTQIFQPVWSPQGNKIAFSLWHDGYQNIYIITLDDKDTIQSINPVTMDHYTNISPNWSPDGQFLYFSSDRSGIFNLYAYELKDETLFQLTNVTSGAFEPAVSPNGKELAFIQYHATGYELHLTDTDKLLWKVVDISTAVFSVPQPILKVNKMIFKDSKIDGVYQKNSTINDKKNTTFYQIKDYSPMDSILPTYWTPFFSLTSNDLYLGFSSLAQDQLKFFTAPFTLAYGVLNESVYYDFQFIHNVPNPTFSFFWQGEKSFSSRLQASINFSNTGYTSKQDSARYYAKNFLVGLQKERYLIDKVLEMTNDENNSRKVNSFILKYSYNDTEYYQSSISPEIGHSYTLSYQHANQIMGSDITFNKIVFDGRKYFPLTEQNQVLALRLVAGIATEKLNKTEQFHLGGSNTNLQLGSVNSTSFPLRGFPASAFSGNHLLLATLEYRFPVQTVEHKIGFKGASIFLERVSGAFFLDAGHAWNNRLFPTLEELNLSFGAELNLKFNQRYSDPFVLTIGMGKAITVPAKVKIYSHIGISF